MILYSLPELKGFADNLYKQPKKVRGLSRGRSEFARFSNNEWRVCIHEKVHRKKCLIIGLLTPPDEQLLKTFLLSHTLKKEKADKVIAILPYLAYTRHDRNEQYQSFITDWIGKAAAASGIDKIITIDIHSQAAKELMGMPVVDISPAERFLDKMTRDDLKDATVIAPDEGAIRRADDFRKVAGISRPIAYFKKIRHQNKVTHIELVGKISGNIIIVDDVLDTGNTLISCAERLRKLGVKKITVAVTHGLFTGERWKRLFKLNVAKIITTDSTLSALRIRNKKIKVVSCVPLLAKALNQDI